MKFFELVKVAIFSLWSSKTRTMLTMLGIVIGISSVIVIIGFSAGQNRSIEEEFAKSGANRLTITVSGTSARNNLFTMDDVDYLYKSFPGRIAEAAPVMTEMGSYEMNREEYIIQSVGTTQSYEEIFDLEILSGRFFTDQEVTRQAELIVIDQNFAIEKFGSIAVEGNTLLIDYEDYKRKYVIVGVYQSEEETGLYVDNSSKTVYVPYSVFPTHHGLFETIELELMSSTQVDTDSELFVGLLESIHENEGESVYQTRSMASIAEMMSTVLSTMTLVLVAIAAISLLVGGIGVMNIMLVSVTERTREIGIRKAIGATKRDILLQFVIESIVITGFGGILGVVLGIALLVWTTPMLDVPLVVSFWSIGLAVGFSSLLGIFFGIYPAYRAAGLAPVDALRYE